MTRLAILMTTGLLVALPAAPALAQSAGDEQYSDPLGQTTPAPSAPAPAPAPAPAAQPQGAAGSGNAGATAQAPPAPAQPAAAAAASGAAATELPRTGAEPGVVALVGVVLALLGIGLRRRTADARP